MSDLQQGCLVIAVATSCDCDACRRIPSLGLKFLAHHGSFVEHDVAGQRELVGADVILIHRLLKNSITESTGLRGYALLTDACSRYLGIDTDSTSMREHRESYEHIGDVAAHVLDLEARWADEHERVVARLNPEDADLTYEATLAASVASVPSRQDRDHPGQRVLYRVVGRRMRRILQDNFESLSDHIAAGHRTAPPTVSAGTSIPSNA